MNKKIIGIVAIIAIALIIIGAVYFSQQPPPIEGKISELKDKGYNVEDCPMTFDELKAERIGEGGVFEQTTSWSIFLQQIQTVKANLGFVTVWVCKDDNIYGFMQLKRCIITIKSLRLFISLKIKRVPQTVE